MDRCGRKSQGNSSSSWNEWYRPSRLVFVEGIASAPVFKLLGKAGKWLLGKSGLKKAVQSNFNLDFINEKPYVTPEEFYSLDVVPRSTLKYNNPIKNPLTDFSYEKVKMSKGVGGDFNPTTGKVRISETLTPMREAATKVHEFRHRLDETYKRIIPQNKLLDSYKVYRGAAHKASSELEEKMATNTEFRYLLFNEYTKKFGKKPTVAELNKYIDNMSVEELSSRLNMVNGYGQDYVGTFSKWVDGERKIVYETSDRQRGELLNKTVDNWEKNIKSALKYVPGITGATLVPKNKNSQPSN